MLKQIVGSGLRPKYSVFDTHYSVITAPDGLPRSWEDWSFWVGTLHPRTIILWRGQRRSVAELGQGLPLKWRKRLGMRAASESVYAPKYGSLRLVVPRNLSSAGSGDLLGNV